MGLSALTGSGSRNGLGAQAEQSGSTPAMAATAYLEELFSRRH